MTKKKLEFGNKVSVLYTDSQTEAPFWHDGFIIKAIVGRKVWVFNEALHWQKQDRIAYIDDVKDSPNERD